MVFVPVFSSRRAIFNSGSLLDSETFLVKSYAHPFGPLSFWPKLIESSEMTMPQSPGSRMLYRFQNAYGESSARSNTPIPILMKGSPGLASAKLGADSMPNSSAVPQMSSWLSGSCSVLNSQKKLWPLYSTRETRPDQSNRVPR